MAYLYRKKYYWLLGVLTLAPVCRELVLKLLLTNKMPFQTAHDVWHTGIEMFFMLMVGGFLVMIDARLTHEKQTIKMLDNMVRRKTQEIKLTQKISIEAISTLAEYRDSDTGKHLQRIQEYVKALTKELQGSVKYGSYLTTRKDYLEEITMASILHDIGKIAIPNRILLKPGKLTTEEFEKIKEHPVIGGKILERADQAFRQQTNKESYLALARTIALFHHEKWDGSGYPEGLAGEAIPLSARITALCDVYDAVTTDRVYKQAWSHEKARLMIVENRASHFDPEVTDAFMRIEKQFDGIRRMYKD